MRELEVRRLGVVPYAVASDMQRALVEERRAGRVPDILLLLEHPHVITLGVKADAARSHLIATPELLAARQVEVHESGRGGDITYHGPGQIVGYPILDLHPDRCDVHKYVRDLEDVMIRTTRDFGVESARIAGLSGAWVGADKIGAIGVRISRWITSHGFAFNVTTDLDFFNLIVPCGIETGGVTSLSRAAGRRISMDDAEASIVRNFAAVFDRTRCRGRRHMKMIYRPTFLTLLGVATTIAAISGTTGYILGRAPSIPALLPVHFDDRGHRRQVRSRVVRDHPRSGLDSIDAGDRVWRDRRRAAVSHAKDPLGRRKRSEPPGARANADDGRSHQPARRHLGDLSGTARRSASS